jgi:hypothetical protein
MEMPRRQELQKIYEELIDEILIEIAQNFNQEYETIAVEVAKAELDKRGIDIPGPNEGQEPHSDYIGCLPENQGYEREDYKQSGRKLTGPVIEIPRFKAEETSEIERIFAENGIDYERHAVRVKSCSSCGCNEYIYHVSNDSFHNALDLLKEHYMIGNEKEMSSKFSGTCPACGTEIVNVEKCTDCGLTLGVDYSEIIEKHPFVMFLRSNNLLS